MKRVEPRRFAALLCVAVASASAGDPPSAAAPANGAASSPAEVISAMNAEIEAQRREQRRLVEAVEADIAKMPADSPARAQKQALLAAIEKRIADEDVALARTRYLTARMEADPVFGAYCASLRRSIEARGAAAAPSETGPGLDGNVVMNLRIDAAGRLVATDIVRGAVDPAVDRRALAVAWSAGPFGPFTPGMQKQADLIVYTTTFHFTAAPAKGASAP